MLAWRSSARNVSPYAFRLYRTKASTKKADAAKPSTDEAIATAQRGSTHHDDLKSFLKHAEVSGLAEKSTVYVGTHYEYTVVETLKLFGFSLTRTGRSSDLGIDLVGQWTVASSPSPLRTIIQCKARSKKLAPENVRELEGAFTGAPAGWRAKGVLGFLIAPEAATKGVRDAMVRSSLPLGFMQISREGRVKQCLWNHVASENGLEGLGVTLRHDAVQPQDEGMSHGGSDVVLTWKGRALSPEEVEVK